MTKVKSVKTKMAISSLISEQTNANLELVFASMPGYIYWKNKQSQYAWCNDGLAKVAGLKHRSEIVGKTDYDFAWGKELADQFVLDDQRVLQTGIVLTKEYQLPIKREDGHFLTVRTDKLPLYDEQRNVMGVLAIAIDITDQKLAEKETHIAHTFVEDILYNLPGLIYWKNKQSQYVGFNRNVVHLSGLTREELVGKTDLELNWGKKEAEVFQMDDQAVMETGASKVTEHQIPIKRPDGHYMIVRTEKSRLYDRNGNIAGVLGVALDITDQKILEVKLIAEKERAEQLNQAKTAFIRNMEHDVRTPFSGVYSIAKILEKKETDKEKRDLLKAVSQCAKELLDYCNGILDFSVIESGTMPVLAKKFDLKALVESVIAMEKPAAMSKHLQLIMEYPDDMPTIFIGDQYRLQRVLINLVSNAVKFTPKGYVKLGMKMAKKIDGKTFILRLFVEDTGVGIPKEKQAIIYERFSRLSPSNQGKYKGTGLGLSIVRCLIEELEGEIDVESRPGKGTTFVCTLPLKRPLLDEILF